MSETRVKNMADQPNLGTCDFPNDMAKDLKAYDPNAFNEELLSCGLKNYVFPVFLPASKTRRTLYKVK